MRKYIALPAVSLLALALAACSTPPNANLEQARSNFSALQSQPDATKVAALKPRTPATGWPRPTRPIRMAKTSATWTNWPT